WRSPRSARGTRARLRAGPPSTAEAPGRGRGDGLGSRAPGSCCLALELFEERRELRARPERLAELRHHLHELDLEGVSLFASLVDDGLALGARGVELLLALRQRPAELSELEVEIVRELIGRLHL